LARGVSQNFTIDGKELDVHGLLRVLHHKERIITSVNFLEPKVTVHEGFSKAI